MMFIRNRRMGKTGEYKVRERERERERERDRERDRECEKINTTNEENNQ